MASNVHTVPAPNGAGWINKLNSIVEGPLYSLKEKAVEAGRKLAMAHRAEHTVHNADGSIAYKNSYGNDPSNIRG
jgi:hypothetical protein